MDYFACDGLHDERMFRSCEESQRINSSVLTNESCACSYRAITIVLIFEI